MTTASEEWYHRAYAVLKVCNFVFLSVFTVQCLKCISKGWVLPPQQHGKSTTPKGLMWALLLFCYAVHVLWYTGDLIYTIIQYPQSLYGFFPGSLSHHLLAAIMAASAILEPRMLNSALFHFPWALHSAAFVLLIVRKQTFALGEQLIPFLIYNFFLSSGAAAMVAVGFKEKWQRYSPTMPVIGLLMAAANYEQYCGEMRGAMCLTASGAVDLHYWLIAAWNATVVMIGVGSLVYYRYFYVKTAVD